MSAKKVPALYRRMRLVFDLELELPEEPGATADEKNALAALMSQPQAIIDAVLMRQALRVLQEVNVDDLSELAGCAENDDELEQLLSRVLDISAVSAGAAADRLAGDLSEHIRASLGVTVRQIANIEPPSAAVATNDRGFANASKAAARH